MRARRGPYKIRMLITDPADPRLSDPLLGFEFVSRAANTIQLTTD